MLHKFGTLGGRKVSPPQPTCMTDDQKSSYLADLRNNRPVRPTGSRPPPFKSSTYGSLDGQNLLTRSDSSQSTQHFRDATRNNDQTYACDSHSPDRTFKRLSLSSTTTVKGRPLAQAPTLYGRKVSPTVTIHMTNMYDDSYIPESVSRDLEKEEVHTLREALTIIDQRDEELRLYDAAQKEAAELVWAHRNPQAVEDEQQAPYRNPDVENTKSYGTQLGNNGRNDVRNISDGSTMSSQSYGSSSKTDSSKHRSRRKDARLSGALENLRLASDERTAEIIATAQANRRRSSGFRQVSTGSNKGMYRNPEVQIYEEPESKHQTGGLLRESPEDLPLKSRHRNSLLRGSRPLPEKPFVAPPSQPKIDRFEIYKNPPTQSRNAEYTANSPTTTPKIEIIEEVDTPRSSTLEIRSDDIRAATSMKRKDRSPKLPTPTAVSDMPGRPIVSFDKSWKPGNDSPRTSQDSERPVIKTFESPCSGRNVERPLPNPTTSRQAPPRSNPPVSTPFVPTINLPDDENDLPIIQVDNTSAPSIAISAPSAPTINIQGEPRSKSRPLPPPNSSNPSKVPPSRTGHLPWLHGGQRGMPTVTCSSCTLPISGRVVTASGSNTVSSLKARLHPECFTCYHCSTPLECVSFYPEPDNKREERLAAEGLTGDSSDADLRFYCHLDFHEFFSPRCRSCKTPIEGEIIIAAGGEWHVGHFFCGECGDPFDSHTPFVEKDGYAYCVSCHTKRTSARCKECKKQILDELTVEALGGKWHEQCFVCYECGGGFGDDGRFFIRDVQVEASDKEKRKGVFHRTEERAVCGACEERRLKA